MTPEQLNDIIVARQLRLAVITNVFRQGMISESSAKELLAGPLTPGDETTIYDDSELLGLEAKGLEIIAIRAAVAAEREACASISLVMGGEYGKAIAAAIRARGDKERAE